MELSDKQIYKLTTAGLNLIQQALSIYDDELRLLQCNRQFRDMFDLPDTLVTPGALFADTVRHLAITGEYGVVDDIEEFVDQRVQQARVFEAHYMERPRAGGRWISVEGAPLPQGGWVTVYTDITRTKQQEELLRTRSELLSEEVLRRSEELAASNRKLAATNSVLEETQHQLRAIEARTRLTTEMMPAHIAHVDATGHYTYSNRRLTSVIPGRPSDILGLHISEALGPHAYAKVQPHLEAAYRGTQSVFEFTENPSLRRIRVSFTPDQHENGVYILSMDVTEETQARVALQQTRRREIATQMISGLAHDFSNLLTVILGMQSKLARMEELPDGADALINATHGAARRGGTLLGRIADMTSSRAYQPVPVDLVDFIDEFRTLSQPSLPQSVHIVTDVQTRGALSLDPGMLQDSLLNLVLNARDACGDTGEIQLTVRESGDTWVIFEITDTGTGFSDDALKQALDPFYTTKGDDGSGLGLAMVYDMTKLAGGEVRLSNTDHGARVVLRLPLRRAKPPPRIAPGMVLLVEDNAAVRDTLREMLTALGHRVVEATSVTEATALVSGLPEITAILSDIQLEGAETGIELARATRDLPLVLMTSLPASHALAQEARDLAPLLQKPFDVAQLATAMANALPAPEITT